MSRWIIAQDEPGPVEEVMWALIDTEVQGVMGRLLGRSFAEKVAEGLNALNEAPEPVQDAQPPTGPLTRTSSDGSLKGVPLTVYRSGDWIYVLDKRGTRIGSSIIGGTAHTPAAVHVAAALLEAVTARMHETPRILDRDAGVRVSLQN